MDTSAATLNSNTIDNNSNKQNRQIEIDQPQTSPLLAWIVCFSSAMFFFYEFIQGNMFNSIATDLMRDFHIDMVQLSWMSSIYYITNVVFLFPAGILLDRISAKKVILVALGLCVIGTFLFANVHSYWMACFCRFLTGIGSAFCFLSCIRLASRWFPARRMALVVGLIVTFAMTGGMVAQTPLTWLTESTSWRHALIYDGILGIGIFLIILQFVRDYPANFQKQAKQHDEYVKQIGFWRSLGMSYFKKQNICCALYTSLLNIPVAIFGAFAGSLYLIQADHISRTEASLITSMIFLGTIIGGPLAGWISDSLAKRRLPMIMGAIISLALVLTVVYSSHLSHTALFVIFFLLGLFTSTQVISYPTVSESNPLALTATAVSVINILTQGGYVVYQPLFSNLLQSHWHHVYKNHVPFYSMANYHSALLILPIGFAIALVAALCVRETNAKHVG